MAESLELMSLGVGAHPLIQPFLDRLRLRSFLEEALAPRDRRCKLPHAESALLLVRNFTLSRHPLYGVPDWARRFDAAQLEFDADTSALINDDRLGRCLDRLFKADLRSLMTRVIVHLVKEFGVSLERLHNDSTTITFTGCYAEGQPRRDGRRRLRIVHGHNKDHRPDLKQLVWALTVSADGAVPVHYNVHDGNVTDDTTHIATWDILREICGRSDFIYVADSKLCTRANMAHIDESGGRFITVLPRTRREDGQFKQWILEHVVPWELIWERPPQRRQDDPPDRFEAVAAPAPTAEGYRIVWYRSSEKWKRDERQRENAISSARFEIHRLRDKVGKRKLKTREQVQAAVDGILDESGARPWLQVQFEEVTRHQHTQATPGRPGRKTRYVRSSTSVWLPVATVDQDAVRASAAADGVFPLVTNITAPSVTPLEILQIYKYQAFVEKRHEQLKTVAEVVPVNFKSPERIEAFLFLYFLALTIQALVERETRAAMKAANLKSIPIYPEERECHAPTAEKIFALFEHMRRHQLLDNGKPVKVFWDALTEVQRSVLDLLRVSPSVYGDTAVGNQPGPPPARRNPQV